MRDKFTFERIISIELFIPYLWHIKSSIKIVLHSKVTTVKFVIHMCMRGMMKTLGSDERWCEISSHSGRSSIALFISVALKIISIKIVLHSRDTTVKFLIHMYERCDENIRQWLTFRLH